MTHIRTAHSTRDKLYSSGELGCRIYCGNMKALCAHLMRNHHRNSFNISTSVDENIYPF